jgi:hypothetical protein
VPARSAGGHLQIQHETLAERLYKENAFSSPTLQGLSQKPFFQGSRNLQVAFNIQKRSLKPATTLNLLGLKPKGYGCIFNPPEEFVSIGVYKFNMRQGRRSDEKATVRAHTPQWWHE